jgi:carboxypeptidase C (cathepsin A)
MPVFPRLAILVIIFSASTLLAAPPTRPSAGSAAGPSDSPDNLSVTQHSINLESGTLNYEATAGTLQLKDDSGKPRANFFFVSYIKQPAAPAATFPATMPASGMPATVPAASPSTRPITFVFNGGPGAAAVWLHLGAVGPKHIQLGPDGIPLPPPHQLVDNPQTWLDTTDLVLIDPVSTGYSRAAEGVKPQDFYGVLPDIESIADFIRIYLTRYHRWESPKFLAGESYGTTRAAALSKYLLDRYGIDLNGIILISSVLNFQTIEPAMGDYLAALSRGADLPADQRAALVKQLAAFTSLKPDLIDKSNLRIDPAVFRKQVLNDQSKIIGRYDGRIIGQDPNPADPEMGFDPSLSYYLPVYTATFNDYIRRELNFESDLNYEVLNGRVWPWDYGQSGQGYLNVTDDLQSALVENPNLHVFVAAGYEDLATPFLAANYTFDHLDPSGRLKSRITQAYYHSGHMVYHDPASRVKLKNDVAEFIRKACGN